MPASGPGRHSFKKKKKKDQNTSNVHSAAALSNTTVVPNIQMIEDHRLSLVATEIDSVNGDFVAMQQLGDQIDEYYYGLRIFPGQGKMISYFFKFVNIFFIFFIDPFNVWVGWVTSQFHSYSPIFDMDSAVRKCRFNELDHMGMPAERLNILNLILIKNLF